MSQSAVRPNPNDHLFRRALIEAHDWTCVICQGPITAEFVVDHMIPQNMAAADRAAKFTELCERLGRPGFDIFGIENVGPAHDKCNQQKGTMVYPDAILHHRLAHISRRVDDVVRRMDQYRSSRDLERGLLIVAAALSTGAISEAEVNARLRAAAGDSAASPLNYSVAWSPGALKSLDRHGIPPQTVEHAVASAVERGTFRLIKAPGHSVRYWSISFTFNGNSDWRMQVIVENGLLLVLGVAPRGN